MTAPRTAMLLAAGLGTRMRPLTEGTSKTLLPLGGRTLLDHALDRLGEAGIATVVVNTHWHAARVAEHLAARAGGPSTIVREENALLDTGGSVRAALDLLGPDPFLVVNGDILWLDGPRGTLGRVIAAWDPARADAVLLAHRTFQVHTETGRGDFAIDKLGFIRRREEREIVPYIYAGIQMLSPACLEGMPAGPFSMNLVWDAIIARERLRAVVHDGLWFHLTTPPDLAEAEFHLQARAVGDTR